jgi:hypothetical protein
MYVNYIISYKKYNIIIEPPFSTDDRSFNLRKLLACRSVSLPTAPFSYLLAINDFSSASSNTAAAVTVLETAA